MINDRLYMSHHTSPSYRSSYTSSSPLLARKAYASSSSPSTERFVGSSSSYNRGKDGIFRPKSLLSLATEIDFGGSSRSSTISPRISQIRSHHRDSSIPRPVDSGYSSPRTRTRTLDSSFYSNFNDNLSYVNSSSLSPYQRRQTSSSYLSSYPSYRFTTAYNAPKVRERPLLSNLRSKFATRPSHSSVGSSRHTSISSSTHSSTHSSHTYSSSPHSSSTHSSSTHNSVSSNDTVVQPRLERNKFLIKFREHDSPGLGQGGPRKHGSVSWDIPGSFNFTKRSGVQVEVDETIEENETPSTPIAENESKFSIYDEVKSPEVVATTPEPTAETPRDENNNLTRWNGSMTLNSAGEADISVGNEAIKKSEPVEYCLQSVPLGEQCELCLSEEQQQKHSPLRAVDLMGSAAKQSNKQLEEQDCAPVPSEISPKVEKIKKKKKKIETKTAVISEPIETELPPTTSPSAEPVISLPNQEGKVPVKCANIDSPTVQVSQDITNVEVKSSDPQVTKPALKKEKKEKKKVEAKSSLKNDSAEHGITGIAEDQTKLASTAAEAKSAIVKNYSSALASVSTAEKQIEPPALVAPKKAEVKYVPKNESPGLESTKEISIKPATSPILKKAELKPIVIKNDSSGLELKNIKENETKLATAAILKKVETKPMIVKNDSKSINGAEKPTEATTVSIQKEVKAVVNHAKSSNQEVQPPQLEVNNALKPVSKLKVERSNDTAPTKSAAILSTDKRELKQRIGKDTLKVNLEDKSRSVSPEPKAPKSPKSPKKEKSPKPVETKLLPEPTTKAPKTVTFAQEKPKIIPQCEEPSKKIAKKNEVVEAIAKMDKLKEPVPVIHKVVTKVEVPVKVEAIEARVEPIVAAGTALASVAKVDAVNGAPIGTVQELAVPAQTENVPEKVKSKKKKGTSEKENEGEKVKKKKKIVKKEELETTPTPEIPKPETQLNEQLTAQKKERPPLTKQPQVQNQPPAQPPIKRTQEKIRFREYCISDFTFLTVLGRGSFGKVLLAELNGYGICFAVKCLKKQTVIEDDDVESIMIERKVLAFGSTNPFICKLFCTFQTESHLFFAMEWCAGGDLMFHVQKEGKFPEEKARFYSCEILCALWFMHKRGIIYRDLKLDNIMVFQDGHIRLVDFGMCQGKMYREELLPSNFCGTPEYMAPEIVKGVKYNHSVDYWALGVVIYEMCVGTSPFHGTDEDELLWNVCNQEVHYPHFLSQNIKNLLVWLLKRAPEERLGMMTCSAGPIEAQPWFQGVKWDLVEKCKVQPPFVPNLMHEADVSYFDRYFTKEEPTISPGGKAISENEQLLFEGFNYTNPNMTD